jgi:enamine deaminase RidA (YjgF/YER057c/UK114 family)
MSLAAHHLNPPGLMESRRFFNQVVAPSGTMVHVAGQTRFRVDRSIAPTKEGQMAQAFENVKIALEAAQARMDQVVSMTVYIVGYTRPTWNRWRAAPRRTSRRIACRRARSCRCPGSPATSRCSRSL